MTPCILGIDPGASGACAFYFPEAPDRISVEDMPTLGKTIDGAALARRIEQMRPTMAVVEWVHAFPQQGRSSIFNFGAAFGAVVHGVLPAMRIPCHLVTPTAWKKHFRLSSDKEESRALAVRLWPSCEGLSRKKDHGRAEAALIARFGAEIILFEVTPAA